MSVNGILFLLLIAGDAIGIPPCHSVHVPVPRYSICWLKRVGKFNPVLGGERHGAAHIGVRSAAAVYQQGYDRCIRCTGKGTAKRTRAFAFSGTRCQPVPYLIFSLSSDDGF